MSSRVRRQLHVVGQRTAPLAGRAPGASDPLFGSRSNQSASTLGSTPEREDAGVEPPAEFARNGLPPFIDRLGRSYSYLRLSVTDRCDFACVYCMPPGGESDHAERPELLSFEESARLACILSASGVDRIRFTGGEPLVRREIVRLVELVARQSGLSNLVMTTNGNRLAELASPLSRAGLKGVNVSVDTLDAKRFREITRGGDLKRVLSGVRAALDAGLEVKINAVLMRGQNDQDACALVDWAFDLGITPRFIELMPLGEAAKLPSSAFMSQAELVSLLRSRISAVAGEDFVPDHGRGPARYLPARDGSARRVGFISAVSNEFCASCNRLRITARGDVRACLASRSAISLRDAMRAGKSDREIAWLVHCALGTKLVGHAFTDTDVEEHTHVGMSLVGG
jgi:cyclic pyranopterin phosphate synthase